MDRDISIAAAQLVISHLCHELVSPVGAINNGVEILEESGAGVDDEAFALIAESGKAAAAKLRFYRLAYGSAGTARDLRVEDIRQASLDLFASEARVTLAWGALPEATPGPGGGQLILNLILLAVGCMPRGGTVEIGLVDLGEEMLARLYAIGPGARRSDALGVLERGDGDGLDHRSIQGYFTLCLARRLGTEIRTELGEDRIGLLARLPKTP